jgi:hypothetical protein
MKGTFAFVLIASGWFGLFAAQGADDVVVVTQDDAQGPQIYETEKHPVIMYIPNRIFDLLDIVRARVRVGPGISAGVRVDSLANVFVGSHNTAFVGLSGPRGHPVIPWPAGLENNPGTTRVVRAPDDTVVAADAYVPYYGPMEFGADAQAAIVGVNVGVELLEVVDFLAGIFLIDLKGDDF